MMMSVTKKQIPSVASNTYATFASALDELSALTSNLRSHTGDVSESIREAQQAAH